jgi:hypothetical protein
LTHRYEIRLEGLLDESWRDWFDGLSVTTTTTETILAGPVPDQAALFGLLAKIRDLGLPLLAVNRLPAGQETSNGRLETGG